MIQLVIKHRKVAKVLFMRVATVRKCLERKVRPKLGLVAVNASPKLYFWASDMMETNYAHCEYNIFVLFWDWFFFNDRFKSKGRRSRRDRAM